VQRRIILLSPQCADATPFNQTGSFLLFQRKTYIMLDKFRYVYTYIK